MENKMFGLIVIMLACAFLGQVHSSAIPMWEYLSKDEKMSYLYSMFANQVEDFCEGQNEHNCNQDLLKFGSDKLKDMSEEHLDHMDPYQRGASNIIWESMLKGHKMMKTSPKPRHSTTAKPNSYDDHSFDEEFGDQGEASARIETVYRTISPSEYINVKSGTPEYIYPVNSRILIPPKPYKYYKDNRYNNNGGAYGYRVNGVEAIDRSHVGLPLTGPMVVKVYPDGRPVHTSEQEPLPQDEDLKQYRLSKIKIPYFYH